MSQLETVGLVPAAGWARRLGDLPVSKELLPLPPAPRHPPRVVATTLLEGMHAAGVRRAYVVVRDGKLDIPAWFGGAAGRAPLSLAFLVTPPTRTVPETLDVAYPFVRKARVLLGFPDVLFRPRSAIEEVLQRHRDGPEDVVLGLFPTPNPAATDAVHLDAAGRVRRIEVKPEGAAHAFTWLFAAWSPCFTEFLHRRLRGRSTEGGPVAGDTGEVFDAAVGEGLSIATITFPSGRYLDVGTPEDLRRALAGKFGASEVAET